MARQVTARLAVLALLVGVLLVGAPATGAAQAGAAPAWAAQSEVLLDVNPNTIQAGGQVAIRGNCGGDHVNPATVRSRAFGSQSRITLMPDQHGQLTDNVNVPTDVRAGRYTVTLECAGRSSVSVDLFVLDMAQPTRGPATGGGGTAGATGPGAAPILLAAGVAVAGGGLGLLLFRRHRSA